MFKPISLRTFNSFDPVENSNLDSIHCNDPSLTVQDSAEETDINYIVRKFGITGQLPNALHPPTYGDFVGVTDYQSALHAITAADDAFMQMPADIRSRFDNDPGKFVDFCSDPVNHDAMLEMGLLDPAVLPQVGSSPEVNAAGGQAGGATGRHRRAADDAQPIT